MMKKTSGNQFQLMVEYMEKHGYLSKPGDGPSGRINTITQWNRLTDLLNADGSGDIKTVERWRKVWSDLKNNTKRKAAKCNQAARGTGGGPALKIKLTDLELRVLHIIGPQAVTGMTTLPEVGIEEVTPEVGMRETIFLDVTQPDEEPSHQGWSPPQALITVTPDNHMQPPLSSRPVTPPRIVTSPRLVTPSRPSTPRISVTAPTVASTNTPRRRRRLRRNIPISPLRRARPPTQSELAAQMFANSDREWREFLIERENRRHLIEQENLRLREMALNEQSQWREMMTLFLHEQSQWRQSLSIHLYI